MCQPIALRHQKYLLRKLWEDASVEWTQNLQLTCKQKYKCCAVLHNSSAWSGATCRHFCVKERTLLFVFLFRFSGQRLFEGLAGEHLVSHGCVVNKASDDYSNLLEIIRLQAIVDVHI
jgi:hypothetical protein